MTKNKIKQYLGVAIILPLVILQTTIEVFAHILEDISTAMERFITKLVEYIVLKFKIQRD